MLNGKLSLHDIADVEKFAANAAREGLRNLRVPYLSEHHKDSLVAYLITDTWRLGERYDPARNTSFSKFAYAILQLRVTSWYRDEFGDTRRIGQPQLVALDTLHGESLTILGSGPTPDSTTDLQRLDRERRRARTRDLAVIREGLVERSAA